MYRSEATVVYIDHVPRSSYCLLYQAFLVRRIKMGSFYSTYLTVALLLRTTQVIARLLQTDTNGNSLFGNLSAPTLPDYFTDNPLPDGFPWGTATAFNTNYYTASPNTGFSPTLAQEMTANVLKVSPESTIGLSQGGLSHQMVTKSR
jgi:hypothetical protein